MRVHPDAFWYFPGFLEGAYERVGEPGSDGWVTSEVTFFSADDARTRVLGLGAYVDVIAPDDLKRAVINTAGATLARYDAAELL